MNSWSTINKKMKYKKITIFWILPSPLEANALFQVFFTLLKVWTALVVKPYTLTLSSDDLIKRQWIERLLGRPSNKTITERNCFTKGDSDFQFVMSLNIRCEMYPPVEECCGWALAHVMKLTRTWSISFATQLACKQKLQSKRNLNRLALLLSRVSIATHGTLRNKNC